MVIGRRREDLDADRMLNLALVRLLEVVGEAAGRVDAGERSRYPRVAWTEIIGMRNRLIHGYDQVDFDLLWQIVTKDLPPLVAEIDSILATHR